MRTVTMSGGGVLQMATRHADEIGTLVDHWQRLGMSEATIRLRLSLLHRLPRPVSAVTADDCLSLMRPGLHVNTLNAYGRQMRQILGDARDLGLRADNPLATVRVPRPKAGRPRPLTADQVECLLGLDGDELAWTVLGLRAGCRIGDLPHLRADDLYRDGEGWILRLAHGKGGTDVELPAHPDIVAVVTGLGRTGRLWRMTSHSMGLRWRKAARGVGVDATFHALRHTYATALYRETQDILVVRDLMRHRSVSSTQVYAAADPMRLAPAIDALPRLGGGGAQRPP